MTGHATRAIRTAALALAFLHLNIAAAGAADVTDCDRLAADPWDARRVVQPQAPLATNAGAAVEACRQAVAVQPDEPRLRFQLGRALLFHGLTGEAVTELSRAAETSYAAAAFHLGLAYDRESWSGHDTAAARSHYRNGAELGHAQAQHIVALRLLEDERGDGRGLRAALPWLERASEQGLAESLYLQGVIYSNGGNTLWPDLERAADLFGKAVELDHDAARLALGNAYVMGRGVRKEPARGLALIAEAAENGLPDAQIELGRMYMTGRAVEQDEERGYKWFCAAKEPGRTHFEAEYGRALPCNAL